MIPKPVKKLEKLFIAPKVRQVLYETSQRAFTRCACAQRTGFLIKFFNQESVSELPDSSGLRSEYSTNLVKMVTTNSLHS